MPELLAVGAVFWFLHVWRSDDRFKSVASKSKKAGDGKL
jgi:hypothetical protein